MVSAMIMSLQMNTKWSYTGSTDMTWMDRHSILLALRELYACKITQVDDEPMPIMEILQTSRESVPHVKEEVAINHPSVVYYHLLLRHATRVPDVAFYSYRISDVLWMGERILIHSQSLGSCGPLHE